MRLAVSALTPCRRSPRTAWRASQETQGKLGDPLSDRRCNGRRAKRSGRHRGTEAGKLHKMPMPSLDESGAALALLREAAPLATEGYSEERRVRFREQPQALRAPAAS